METGLSWLVAKGLLAPLGTTPTLASLAETLFQVGALPNTPLQTLNRIHVVAFLLQESELTSTAKEISTLVSKELAPIVDSLQSNLRQKMEEFMTKLHKKVAEVMMQTKTSIKELGKVTE